MQIKSSMSVIKTYLRKAYMVGTRYSGLSALLSPALSGVGAVLMLHHVRPRVAGPGLNAHLEVTPDFLGRLIERLKSDGSRFVSMDEASDRLARGHTDERFLAVTLDDGYRDNLEYAVPVFSAHDVPYTIFICPGLVEGTADLWWEHVELAVARNDAVRLETDGRTLEWNCGSWRQKHETYAELMRLLQHDVDEDDQRELARHLAESCGVDCDAHNAASVMTWDEIAGLARDRLATIGAHTVNHFSLGRLTRDRAEAEMVRSADILEERLGARPRHFAFPYGNAAAAGSREVEIAARAGFLTAVTTRHGVLMPGHARHMQALPRISVNGYYQRIGYVRAMLSGITVPAANRGRRLVTV